MTAIAVEDSEDDLRFAKAYRRQKVYPILAVARKMFSKYFKENSRTGNYKLIGLRFAI